MQAGQGTHTFENNDKRAEGILMAGYDYDFFVIGAGSAGVRASRVAATHGARVAVAEDRYLGGTCVNVGCVPKKLFTYAAHFAEDFEDAAGFGWTVGEREFAWPTLIANKNAEIARLNGIYQRLLQVPGTLVVQAAKIEHLKFASHLSDLRYGWPSCGAFPPLPSRPR